MKIKNNYVQVKSLEEAKTIIEKPFITIECEFGDKYIKGDYMTIVHHGEFSKNLSSAISVHHNLAHATYDYMDSQDLPIEGKSIMVNALDLDTMLAIYVIECSAKEEPYMGENYPPYAFLRAVDRADRFGVHKLKEWSTKKEERVLQGEDTELKDKEKAYKMVLAYHTWANEIKLKFEPDFMVQMQKGLDFIESMIKDDSIIEEYYNKETSRKQEVESMLFTESEKGRLFNTTGIFCGADYEGKSFIVAFNQKFKAVTLSFEDGGKQHNAVTIMQELFGSEAGGHAGIAGTPRGKEFTFGDAKVVFDKVEAIV